MASSLIRVEVERDPKDSLRFFATVPDASTEKTRFPSLNLDIAEATKLLMAVKVRRADEAARVLSKGPIGQWLNTHGGSNITVKRHSVSRKKAGTTPSHWRVGIEIAFANSQLAQAFAAFCKIP